MGAVGYCVDFGASQYARRQPENATDAAADTATDAAKDAAARLLAERRRSIVHKCVDGKVPAELEPIVAACLSRRGYS